MIASIIAFLQTHLIPLGAWGVFVGSIIEEVVAPVPSAAVISLSGFIFLTQSIGSFAYWKAMIFVVVLPAALGITIGSLFVYGLAYYFGKPLLTKLAPWLGFSWDDIEKLTVKFHGNRRDEYVLFLLRALPAVPSVAVCAICGLMRFNVKKYLIITFLGSIPRAFLLALLGYMAGEVYVAYASFISKFEKGILIAAILALCVFILYKRRHKTAL